MMRAILRPPLIIIGMHRSGTTMATRMLERLGVFVGWRKEENSESLFFQKLNDWLLTQAGGAWDWPCAFGSFLHCSPGRMAAVDYLRMNLRSVRAVSFWGLRGNRGARSSSPWGWKDPRNTFTLPLWLELFPHAKVLHVCRHGVDVANSLLRRQQAQLIRRSERYRRYRRLHVLRPRRGGFTDSYRCATFSGALSLWQEYTMQSRQHVAALGARALELKYEDLLQSPAERLRQLAAFAGVQSSDDQINEAVAMARPERAYAYRRDEHMQAFAHEAAERLALVGYTV